MQITILGGGGFLGRKMAQRLAADGALAGRAITGLTLFDLAQPASLEAPFPVTCLAGDVASMADVAAAIPAGTGLVVHLAAVVSAAAEADFDLGMRVNLQGTLAVIEACRKLAAPPRVLFTSSVASFGGGQSALLPDEARQVPTNSYGAQKAAAELLLQDASRKGFLDAVSIRLPTVIVRPGLAVSVGEMLAALTPAERALVKRAPDAAIADIVGGWPAEFMATRARALGFAPQEGVPEILAAFRADDLAATRADRGM